MTFSHEQTTIYCVRTNVPYNKREESYYEKGGYIMPNRKQTSRKVAKKASRILRDKRFSSDSKSVAGSALAQTKKK